MTEFCARCKAPVMWAETERNGKPIPLDPEPVPDGNLGIRDDGRVYHVAQGQGVLDLGVPLYKTHFATCPDADEHRR